MFRVQLFGSLPDLVARDQLPSGMHLDARDGIGGELRGGCELPQRFDLVAEELGADGTSRGAGEDVDDAPADGELAPVLDDVGPVVSERREPLRELIRRQRGPSLQDERVRLAERRDVRLHRCDGRHHEHERSGRAPGAPRRFVPACRDLRRRADPLVWERLPSRHQRDARGPQPRAGAGRELLGLVRAGTNREDRGLEGARQRGDDEVGARGRARHQWALPRGEEPLERLRGDQPVEDVFEHSHPFSTRRKGLAPKSRPLTSSYGLLGVPGPNGPVPSSILPGPYDKNATDDGG